MMDQATEQAMQGLGGTFVKWDETSQVAGTILDIEVRQRSFQGKALAYDDGNPMRELVFTLETSTGTAKLTVNTSGIQAKAFATARDALGRIPGVGDRMRVTFTGKQGNARVFVYELRAGEGDAPQHSEQPATTSHADAQAWSAPNTYSDDTPF